MASVPDCFMTLLITALQDLKTTLEARAAVVYDHAWYATDPQGHLEKLQALSHTLQNQVEMASSILPPPLRHYFAQHSYEKALIWIRGALEEESEL